MQAILEEILNPIFWFSVVFVGVLVNLISSFLYPIIQDPIKRFSGKISKRRRKKYEDEASIVKALFQDMERSINVVLLTENKQDYLRMMFLAEITFSIVSLTGGMILFVGYLLFTEVSSISNNLEYLMLFFASIFMVFSLVGVYFFNGSYYKYLSNYAVLHMFYFKKAQHDISNG
jgi:hypothetical protein